MSTSLFAGNEFERAIDAKIRKAAAKRTKSNGTVTRIEQDGTPYVMLDGSDYETPAADTAAHVREGERVTVTVDGGRLAIDGNYSAPATDDRAANAAQITADAAVQNAATAASAAAAATANAAIAEEAAISAQENLKSVVQGATTVEKAVSVMQTALEAVVDYDPDEDEVTEYFWHDANGAHVLGDTSGYRNDIDSTGMTIVDVNTERSAAHFGADGATIGKVYDAQASDNESHMELDYHSLQLIDKEGSAYFYVSDLRNERGQMVETFTAPGGTNIFEVSMVPNGNASQAWATVDGADTQITDISTSSTNIHIADFPAAGADVVIGYVPRWPGEAKAFTYGSRGSGAVGNMSFSAGYGNVADGKAAFAEGYGSTASGQASHAEGSGTALGIFSHAEGSDTVAGEYAHAEGRNAVASDGASHAEGFYTEASGYASHAQNRGTVAASEAQTALGKYNVEDANAAYAAIIGNGTADNARSNALAVDWNGNVRIAGDVQDMSGNAKYLALSGGTMTGGLTIDGSNEVIKDSSYIVQGTNASFDRNGAGGSADVWRYAMFVKDKDNEDFAWMGARKRSSSNNGRNEFQITVDGATSSAQNYLILGMNRDGTRHVQVAESAVWRSALRMGEIIDNDISSNVLCAASAYTALGSITLTPGTWVIVGSINYASGAAGMRYLAISTASGSTGPSALEQRSCAEYIQLAAANSCRLNVTRIVTITANTNYYLKAWQSGVSAGLNATGNITATRVG